ncbi:MAG TPA: TQO small subunit DoxD [Gemmatimonadales bacterium]
MLDRQYAPATPEPTAWRIGIALLRVHVGATWLWYAWPKFARSERYLPPSGYMISFAQASARNATGATRAILEHVILPHAAVWAELARFGELSAGLLLLLGFRSRLGGAIGLAVALCYAPFNYAFHEYHGGLLTLPDSMMAALSAVHILVPSGRMFGLDAVLARRGGMAKTARPMAGHEAAQ